MKNTILISILITGNFVFGQQLPNGSFESWETDNGKTEPVNWSSVQTAEPSNLAGLAPLVITESSDAHSGSKSIQLKNASTFGIVANGIVTTGRVFADLNPSNGYVYTDVADSRWNTPFTGKPDSLVGWYKYTPSGGDKAAVSAVLHTGTAKIPDVDSVNYVGHCKLVIPNTTVSTWQRFSIPFQYSSSATPEYILINLTSGDETNAVAGSIALFDDIELIYNPLAIAPVSVASQANVYGGLNQINMDLSNVPSSANWSVTVYDMMGKEYMKRTINAGEQTKFTNVNSGMYICVIQNMDLIVTKKVWVK